jgi:hypothetical protein
MAERYGAEITSKLPIMRPAIKIFPFWRIFAFSLFGVAGKTGCWNFFSLVVDRGDRLLIHFYNEQQVCQLKRLPEGENSNPL